MCDAFDMSYVLYVYKQIHLKLSSGVTSCTWVVMSNMLSLHELAFVLFVGAMHASLW
jgi:hypothetical protein